MAKPNTIEVLNVVTPGSRRRVDATKYEAMRQAMMTVLPAAGPGMTVAELGRAVRPHLDQGVFPGGETAGWWLKCVQLDLEAKGVMARAAGSPVRLRRI